MTPRLLLSPLLTAAAAMPWTTDEDRALAASFASEKRCREVLSWRAAARRALGAEVRFSYDAAGAPVASGTPLRLSVSHTADRVAVLLSEKPCAVDLERADRDVHALFRRILTPAEQALSADPLYPLVACCAKETLYKYAHGALRTIVEGRIAAVHAVVSPVEELPAGVTLEGTTDRPVAAGSIAAVSARIGDGCVLRLTVRRIGDHVAVWIA